MPFTPAHVMAVLPLVRWHRRLRLDPTCLVIGSMSPDFEYFVRGEQVGRISHEFVGIAVWCVPMTLILAALWHHVVKWPVLLAAPSRFARRITSSFAAPWVERWTIAVVVTCVISAAIGALTHILWDGLTHAKGVIVERVPSLTTLYDVPILGEKALHRLLQHTSTVVGLVAVAVYLGFAIRRRPPTPEIAVGDPELSRIRTRTRVVFAACIAAGLGLMAYRMYRMNIADPGSLIVGTISGILGGTLVASMIVRRDARRFRALASSPPDQAGVASA